MLDAVGRLGVTWEGALCLIESKSKRCQVGQGGGRDLLADLYRPPNPNGCGVMLIYGGGFVEGDRGQSAVTASRSVERVTRRSPASIASPERRCGPRHLTTCRRRSSTFTAKRSRSVSTLRSWRCQETPPGAASRCCSRARVHAGRCFDRLLRAYGFPE